jgi:hypothetical protein
VPHVASKASVLPSQHTGLSQRERMTEARTTSPFSILLAETGGPATPARPQAARTQGSAPAQRSDERLSDAQPGDVRRQQRTDEDCAAEAPDAAAAEAVMTEQPDGAAADQCEIKAAAQMLENTEPSTPAADNSSDAASGEAMTIDAVLAAVVETPALPEQPVVTGGTLLADVPALAPAAAEAPSETGAAEQPSAAAPTGTIPAVAPDVAGDTPEGA